MAQMAMATGPTASAQGRKATGRATPGTDRQGDHEQRQPRLQFDRKCPIPRISDETSLLLMILSILWILIV